MKILVVSPHPDDETLGAGGTLLKLRDRGDEVYWLNITDVVEGMGISTEILEHRKDQINNICKFYQFAGFYNLKFPPTKITSIEESSIIVAIKRVLDEVKPEWLIIPGQYDAHSDHRVVYNCCMAASKTFRSPYIRRITTMEIVSETEYGFQMEKFEPNLFIDITDTLKRKIDAMIIYDTEIEEIPFPRSLENIKALATMRGGYCNCRYAEAFHIVKQIE